MYQALGYISIIKVCSARTFLCLHIRRCDLPRFCQVCFESDSPTPLGMERGLLNEGIDVQSCRGAIVACWMDSILRMPFQIVINVRSLSLLIRKGRIVIDISLLYAAVTALSALLIEEVLKGGF